MATLWITIIAIGYLVSQSFVSAQSEHPQQVNTTELAYEVTDQVDGDELPFCFVYPSPSLSTYLPSQVPYFTCMCIWSDSNSDPPNPVWRLEGTVDLYKSVYIRHLEERSSTSGELTESTAELIFPPSSDIHAGRLLRFVLFYEVPGFVNKTNQFRIYVQKSHYDGKCEDRGDCYLTNSRCFQGRCVCLSGFKKEKENSYTCSSGRRLGETCDKSTECLEITTNSRCSASGICECSYPYKRYGSSCIYSYPEPVGRYLGQSCKMSTECTKTTDNSYCSSSGICECNYSYKSDGRYCYYSPSDSTTGPSTWVVFVSLVVIIFIVIGLSSAYAKRRSAMANARRVQTISVTGVVRSNDAAVQTPEIRDDPPSYNNLPSRDQQQTTVETPPPAYDHWEQVPPFCFETVAPIDPTGDTTITMPITNATRSNSTGLPSPNTGVHQGETNRAFVEERLA